MLSQSVAWSTPLNTCQYCQNEYEDQPGSIQVCPLCGESIESDMIDLDVELDLEATPAGEPTALVTDFDSEAAEEFEVDDDFVDDNFPDEKELPSPAPTLKADEVTPLSQDFQVAQPDSDGVFGEFQYDDVSAEPSPPQPGLDTSQADTVMYQPDQMQPTIELERQSSLGVTLDYAERQIVGLDNSKRISATDADADYIVPDDDGDHELGSGACGVVYRAVQKSLGRNVAIKLLKKQVQDGSSSENLGQREVEKFLYESQITASLDHPNVITVHDLGVTKNDTLFYSMKLFEGGRDWSKDLDSNSLEQNLNIFNDVCDAMRRAHRDRIIHRDLKPQNVLVGEYGEVQVTDWGLAVDLKDQRSETFSGGGTPSYMAPEMSQHFLAQTKVQSLFKQLRMTKMSDPNNLDKIAVLEEQLSEASEKVIFYCEQIGELSDVYVLGAILFHIAVGHPPHLYQVSKENRQQLGKNAGKNKVRQELNMSVEGKFANYLVKGLTQIEAREALRDIAIKAMSTKLADRYSDVGELQQAVRDFRGFMRCVEATYRGDQAVANSQHDLKSYVNLNNAIHAYQGALANFPHYSPAKRGLAKARFLFAERALKNQDFELGLSTMTADAISEQPDPTLATQLRQALISQRDRRDRRKRLLFMATVASLIAIAAGVAMGIYASVSANRAVVAQRQELETKQQLKTGLTDLIETREQTIDLQVESEIAELKLSTFDRQSEVSQLQATLAQVDASIEKTQSDFSNQRSQLSQRLANLEKQIAEVETIGARIDSEKIKEKTQYGQYKNFLREIERNVDEVAARNALRQMFLSTDISLAVKNAWEAHHLYKQAHPEGAAVVRQKLEPIALIKSSRDGKTVVALSTAGNLYRLSFNDEKPAFEILNSELHPAAKVISFDIDPSGNWLAIASDFKDRGAATSSDALPYLLNLQSGDTYEFGDEVANELRFLAKNPKSGAALREKFYCRVRHLEFVGSATEAMSLFVVDQRSATGLNQFRCSVLDLQLPPRQGRLVSRVRKAKLPGQLFLKNPGQLLEAGCLASACSTADGDVLAAVASSDPDYRVSLVSMNAADAALNDLDNLEADEFAAQYAQEIQSNQIRLANLSVDFAPTAITLKVSQENVPSMLIGNGKGDLAEVEYLKISAEQIALRPRDGRILKFEKDSTGSLSQIALHQAATPNQEFAVSPRAAFVSTNASVGAAEQPELIGPTFSAHKSVVRDIHFSGDTALSASESEIIVLADTDQGWSAVKTLFGQSGEIASFAAFKRQGTGLYSISNLADQQVELRRWQPDSVSHDAVIKLGQFKTPGGMAKRMVAGTADAATHSQAIAFAFDDGSVEYYEPKSGRKEFSRPAQSILDPNVNKISPSDFNVAKFKLVDDRGQLLMYTNSAGMVSWNLQNNRQPDPVRLFTEKDLFSGPPENSTTYFSADLAGDRIVTSHPKFHDRFLLWRHIKAGQYGVAEVGPLKKTGTESLPGINSKLQPMVSPDGRTIACVIRLRNTYEVQIFRLGVGNQLQLAGKYTAGSLTNFMSMHFADNDQITVVHDQATVGGDNQNSLVQLSSGNGVWRPQELSLPKQLSDNYDRLSVNDVAVVNGVRYYVGFGMEVGKPDANATDEFVSTDATRQLLVWNEGGKVLSRDVSFSRRIAPKIVDGKLQYFVGAERSGGGYIQIESLDQAGGGRQVKNGQAIGIDTVTRPARRWQALGSDKIIVSGKDWFHVVDLGQNQPNVELAFTIENPARQVHLSGNTIFVLHQDASLSRLAVDTDDVKRFDGFYRSIALSPSGTFLALANKDQNRVRIVSTAADGNKAEANFESESFAMVWLPKTAVQFLQIDQQQWTSEVLVTASLVDDAVRLAFFNSDGQHIPVDDSYQVLPLLKKRALKHFKSLSMSTSTGKFISVVWDDDQDDNADIWRYSPNEAGLDENLNAKQAEAKGPHAWFKVNVSQLGIIDSVSFSEVNSTKDVGAARIVIASDNGGSKSVRLYGLGLGIEFETKPLLDLFVADKLQRVDELVGAVFSGDGKTLLTMTADRAQLRLTSGWNIEKRDADFDKRIREFNIAYEVGSSGDLQSQWQATKQQLDALELPASISQLAQQKQAAQSDLNAAEDVLQQMQTDLSDNQDKIRNSKRSVVQEEIASIKSRIEQIDNELESQQP